MAPKPINQNVLFYGDNLPILREHFSDESIDLIYLDPPFNSNRSYNVLFKEEGGQESEAQISAFDDTWHWDKSAARTYYEIIQNAPSRVAEMIGALHSFIGENQMMAYLVMMTARLLELHRVLKPTGSLYLHCDPTASHYLKIVLDTIFGAANFRNEIIWCYEIGGRGKQKWGRKHDVILFFTKSDIYTFNYKEVSIPRKLGTHMKTGIDEDGREYQEKQDAKSGKIYRYYLDEGEITPDWWTGIQQINREARERLGYPTQKPQELLERIIKASSNPGDFVLDPFCGCGTAIAVAQKLDRRWIGIDVTYLAISLQKYRLKDAFNIDPGKDYLVIGEPVDLDSAKQLAADNRYQFQWWACGMIEAMPLGGEQGTKTGKKGKDLGIDGKISFIDDAKDAPKSVLVQVKSGHVKAGDMRDLHGTVDRENAAIGVFITLEQPTSEMNKEALSAGYYTSALWQKDYQRIQILTVEQLFQGERVQMPPAHGTFKKAERVKKPGGSQGELDI
jgi:site-specific DNA-methyltransferase (adenine-specific)